ncbi:hypothetical protein MKK84_23790 [Methylobacterium sp. E-065]|uniref:hypothetical protein n=1 Tax=Methylobacterium sp. E-065 TaxID=2836583 RepID=UPI001FBB6022|nr:hypothetical protein [Methylobacterium sp. E-065]MCJ2020416.1 hypothetical protein [Methylobacterium sp. E-065]
MPNTWSRVAVISIGLTLSMARPYQVFAQVNPDPTRLSAREITRYWRGEQRKLQTEYNDIFQKAHMMGDFAKAEYYHSEYVRLSKAMNAKWRSDLNAASGGNRASTENDRKETKHSNEVAQALHDLEIKYPNRPDVLRDAYWKIAKAHDPLAVARDYQNNFTENRGTSSAAPVAQTMTSPAASTSPIATSPSNEQSLPMKEKRAAVLIFFKKDPRSLGAHESKVSSATEILKSRFSDIDDDRLRAWKAFFGKIDNPAKVAYQVSPNDEFPEIRLPTEAELKDYQYQVEQGETRVASPCVENILGAGQGCNSKGDEYLKAAAGLYVLGIGALVAVTAAEEERISKLPPAEQAARRKILAERWEKQKCESERSRQIAWGDHSILGPISCIGVGRD